MKSVTGNLLVLGTTLLTIVLWITATPLTEITPFDRAAHAVGGVVLNSLFIVFLLSTRNKKIVDAFGGLNSTYKYHKYLAIFAIVAILFHAGLAELAAVREPEVFQLSKVFAQLATALFVFLSFISLVGNRLKYESWRLSHRLMLIAYIIGLFHTVLSSKYDLFQLNALSVWTWLTALIGILSGVYIIFIYQKRQFTHKGTITNLQKLNKKVIELEVTLDHQLDYNKGQFVFVKVLQDGIESAPHPFSLSGGDGKKISLTIKSSGDFTKQLYDELRVNSKIIMDGPYGHLDFHKGSARQLWIAGGIGITPFIAFLRDGTLTQSIDMYYSYRGKENALYKDFLENFEETHQHFHVHFVDSLVDERMNFENYPLEKDTSIFMCGPAAMMNSFARTFREKNKEQHMVYEGFNLK